MSFPKKRPCFLPGKVVRAFFNWINGVKHTGLRCVSQEGSGLELTSPRSGLETVEERPNCQSLA